MVLSALAAASNAVSFAHAQSVLGGPLAPVPQPESHTLDWPVGEVRDYRVESGLLSNDTGDFAVVYGATVTIENAAWLRLFFHDAELPAGSFIRMTSALDGEFQELDASDLAMWDNSSAYFNGDTVYLELIAAPRTARNLIRIDRVGTEILSGPRSCGGDGCGICGADDRVPSSELWTGRLMPVGCTASIWSEESCLVSAGHCAQSGLVVQFNVPASSGNCNPNNPPVADQFPITSFQFQNGGIGADWSVMIPGTNNLGQKPYERYGVLRPISATLANPGNPATVFGYGIDDDQNTRSQTQQTHTGTISGRASTYYTFNVDITYGNSGSALLVGNQIVGIVTHCSYSCLNYATRVDLTGFANARNNLCPDLTAPQPNPMTFAVLPAPASATSITMTATTATDMRSPPVQYEFDFVSGGSGGTDSGWVASTTYVDSGLSPDTQYTYRVHARDSASTPNVNAYSSNATTTTLASVPDAPSLSSPTQNSMVLDVNPGGNPTYTTFAVQCTATSPLDPIWNSQYADVTGLPSAAAAWHTDADWGTLTLMQMQSATTYTFAVKARNLDAVETAFGPSAALATLGQFPLGDLNCDGTVDFGDINPFVLALADPVGYANAYPSCDINLGDINSDGSVNFGDINPFIALLTS
jgi:hypothetical protein